MKQLTDDQILEVFRAAKNMQHWVRWQIKGANEDLGQQAAAQLLAQDVYSCPSLGAACKAFLMHELVTRDKTLGVRLFQFLEQWGNATVDEEVDEAVYRVAYMRTLNQHINEQEKESDDDK